MTEEIIYRMVGNFPGLLDGKTEVNGADFVDWWTNEIFVIQNGAHRYSVLAAALRSAAKEGAITLSENNE